MAFGVVGWLGQKMKHVAGIRILSPDGLVCATSLYSASAKSDFTGFLMKLSLNKDGGSTYISHWKYGSMSSLILCEIAEHRLHSIARSMHSVFFRPTLTPGWRSCKVLIYSDRFK